MYKPVECWDLQPQGSVGRGGGGRRMAKNHILGGVSRVSGQY